MDGRRFLLRALYHTRSENTPDVESASNEDDSKSIAVHVRAASDRVGLVPCAIVMALLGSTAGDAMDLISKQPRIRLTIAEAIAKKYRIVKEQAMHIYRYPV